MKKLLLFTCGITLSVISVFAQLGIQGEESNSIHQFDAQGNIKMPSTNVEPEPPTPSDEELQVLQRINLIQAINKQNKGKTQLALDSVEVYNVNSPVDSAWQYKWYYKYNSLAQVIEKGRKNDLGYFLERWLYQYDGYGNIVSEIYQGCDNNVWYNSSKVERAYNNFGRVILNSLFNWSNDLSQWVGVYKYVYIFNELGQQIFYERYNWSTSYNNWNGLDKYERTFHGSTGYITHNISYTWNTNTQSWINSSKYSYQYNSANLQTYYDTYTWDIIMNDWKGVEKRIYEYNENNLNNNYWQYSWDVNTWSWVNNYKSNLYYNYDNWWIGTNGYYWNVTTGNWEFTRRALVTYDGLLQTRIWETRTTEADPWVNGSKVVTEFNDQRYVLYQEVWAWELVNSNWVSTTKAFWNYNLSGMQTFYDYYLWDIAQGNWIRTRTFSRAYNEQNLLLSSQEFQWNTSGVLTLKSRYERGYNNDGLQNLSVNYYGPAGDTTWIQKRTQVYIPISNIVLLSKTETRVTNDSEWITQNLSTFEFDNYGNRTLYIDFSNWSSDFNTWYSGFKEVSTFSPDGSRFIYTKGVYWNYINSIWSSYNYQSQIYYYSTLNPTSDNTIFANTKNALQLYPNPASGVVNISTEKPSVVEVFSLTGQIITQFYCENTHILDVSSYPSGVYIVKVGTKAQRFIKR